jgi:hypothetical protein
MIPALTSAKLSIFGARRYRAHFLSQTPAIAGFVRLKVGVYAAGSIVFIERCIQFFDAGSVPLCVINNTG